MDQCIAEELLEVNESLGATMDCEKNEKFLNRIYLNQILGQSPSAYEMDTLDSLARSCVNEVGKAALWAHTFLPDSVNFYRAPLMFCEETEELTTGTNNDKSGEELQLYPVPCQDLIQVHSQKIDGVNKVAIVNVDGFVVYEHFVNHSNVFEMDVHHILPGVYWIKFIYNNGKTIIRRIVKV